MIHRGSVALTAGEERRRAAQASRANQLALVYRSGGGQHQRSYGGSGLGVAASSSSSHPRSNSSIASSSSAAAVCDNVVDSAAWQPPQIELSEVAALFSAYGVSLPPRDVEIYRRAMTHQSAAPGGDELLCNERMEYAGDGVLEAVFKTHVVRRYPHLREDRLSNLKVALVNNVTIGSAVRAMGLDRWYQIAPEKRRAVLNDDKAMGDLFEAFMGAIVADYDDAHVALVPPESSSSSSPAGDTATAASGDWCVYWPAAAAAAEAAAAEAMRSLEQAMSALTTTTTTSTSASSATTCRAVQKMIGAAMQSLEQSRLHAGATVDGSRAIMRMGRGPGLMMAQAFAEGVYERHVDWTALLATETNFKGVLQERMQRELCKAPVYLYTTIGKLVQMTVWWNWGHLPPDRRMQAVSLLEQVQSFDALRAMKARAPYVHMLLIELPPMKGTIKEVEQHAAELICQKLPPSHHRARAHEAAATIVRRPIAADAAGPLPPPPVPAAAAAAAPPPLPPLPSTPEGPPPGWRGGAAPSTPEGPPPGWNAAPSVDDNAAATGHHYTTTTTGLVAQVAQVAPLQQPATTKSKPKPVVTKSMTKSMDDARGTAASLLTYRASSVRKGALQVCVAPVPRHELHLGPAAAPRSAAAVVKKRKFVV